jgi:GT2 family glycosyltransferase
MIALAEPAPEVVIVVPTLGTRLDYLELCVASLMDQTYAHLRVVLVGPQDSPVPEVAARHGVAFVAQPRTGIGAAINAGWNAQGKHAMLWGWLGDDDLLPPSSVATAVSALCTSDAVMVYGQCRYIDEAGKELWVAKPGRLAAANLAGGVDLIPQPGSLAVAEAVRQVGMVDEGLRYAMDYDLFLRLRGVGRLTYVPSTLACFRWHEESLTAGTESGSEAEAAEVRARHRERMASRGGVLRQVLALKVSKLHWHLQRRPARVMLDGIRQSLR